MKTIGVVLARLDSKRLPSKALNDVLGRPLISYVIERALRVRSLAHVVIATSVRPIDDALADYGRKAGIAVFRGSAKNVAHRCLECSRGNGADFFVRMNADSPFVDPDLLEQGIRMASDRPLPDLVTNLVGRTFPYGVSVEVVNVATMERIIQTLGDDEVEHVTKRFYDRPEAFRLRLISSPFPHLGYVRLVVDTPEDLARFREIAEVLGSRVTQAPYQEVTELYLSRSGLSRKGSATASLPGEP